MVSGLASTIRSTLESSTFDLSGHDASSIQSIISDAFSTDFFSPPHDDDDHGSNAVSGSSHHDMIRLTFLVGAGKQSRSRYDPHAARAVTSALTSTCGYREDRAASCIAACGGTFKLQHDTAKNLKTVVVFPRVVGGGGVGARSGTRDGDDRGDAMNNDENEEPLLPPDSPGYKLAVTSLVAFQTRLSTHCPTYQQKQSCKQTLEGLLQLERSIETKMMNGHVLLPPEKEFYEESSELEEKMSFLQSEMSRHVDDGRLTLEEKKRLVKMNEKRIQTLKKERREATSASLKGSVDEWLEKALRRKEQLEQLPDDVLLENERIGKYPPPLRYESQLTRLRKKLLPLRALEEASKGRLLSLNETKALTEKDEIENEIEKLEEASCGWFEDEETFRERIRWSRERFEAKYDTNRKQQRSGSGKGGIRSASGGRVSGNNTVNKWILPGEKPKGQQTNAWGMSLGKKKKARGGAVFSAMMMDSSSDEEEDDDNDDEANHNFDDSSDEEEEMVMVKPKNTTRNKSKVSTFDDNTGTNNSHDKSKPRAHSIPEDNDERAAPQASASPNKKKKKSNKSKKKKKSKQHGSVVSDDEDDWDAMREYEVDDAASEEIDNDAKNETGDSTRDNSSKESTTISNSFVEFLREIVFPIIMAILDVLASFLANLISGNKTKSRKGRGVTAAASAAAFAATSSKKGKKKKN
mmetsp:Transcript_14204/g.28916  ORF Transcript_14204/g.28916 Transcript_14204/m.28916 type:complete len:694 (-) Transcript_14204:331-2412(-)